MSETRRTPRRTVVVLVCVALALVGILAVVLWPPGATTPPSAAPSSSAPPAPSVAADPPSVPPVEPPAPEQYPQDAAAYDLSALPTVDVFAVLPALPLDATPADPVLPLVATPATSSIPVFAAPGQPPVAQLASSQQHDGTTVPVVEQHAAWARVLLPARSGLPSGGVAGQTTGWVRTADVTLAENPYLVTVSLSTGQLTVTTSGVPDLTTTGFGYGTPSTPTPVGRTFIMTTFTDPGAGYTRGHPIVALAVQSPTLDGFRGTPVAVTAFHYHDTRSGAVSNGCVRVDAATIGRLATLPLGTPVVITA